MRYPKSDRMIFPLLLTDSHTKNSRKEEEKRREGKDSDTKNGKKDEKWSEMKKNVRSEMKMNTIIHGDMKEFSIKQIDSESRKALRLEELLVRKLRCFVWSFSICGRIPDWKMNKDGMLVTVSISAIQLHIFYDDKQQTNVKVQQNHQERMEISSFESPRLSFCSCNFNSNVCGFGQKQAAKPSFSMLLLCFGWNTKPDFYGSVNSPFLPLSK